VLALTPKCKGKRHKSLSPSHLVHARAANRADVVVQWCGPELCIHNVAGLLVEMGNPLTELSSV